MVRGAEKGKIKGTVDVESARFTDAERRVHFPASLRTIVARSLSDHFGGALLPDGLRGMYDGL